MIYPVGFMVQAKNSGTSVQHNFFADKTNRFVLQHSYMFRLIMKPPSGCFVKIHTAIYYENFVVMAVCFINKKLCLAELRLF
jgi:hypothetical protein